MSNEPARSKLPYGLFKNLVLWLAERFGSGADEAVVRFELETIFAFHLIEAGWKPASVAARADSYARLVVWCLIGALKERHDPAKQIVLAKRIRAIAADARKILILKQDAAVIRRANRVAKEIRQVAPYLDWQEAEAAAVFFDRVELKTREKEAISLVNVVPIVERLDRFVADLMTIGKALALPIKRGRPRASRLFGLTVELLAQTYFRDTGKLPMAGVYQRDGRVQGDFFDLVNQTTKGSSSRPRGRKALAKAITRVLDTSRRVPGSRAAP